MTTNQLLVKDGKIVIDQNDTRKFTTDGKLINAIRSSVFSDTINVAFPDFPKGKAYLWTWTSTYNFLPNDQYGWTSTGTCVFTRTPQEYVATSIIGTVPTGTDLLWGRVKLNRTTSPTTTWAGSTVRPLIKEDVWIPFNGTAFVEARLNMIRLFSIYIDGTNIILHVQQTMGPASGGYGSVGSSTPTTSSDSSHQEWNDFGTKGMPVWISNSSPYRKTSSGVVIGFFPPYTQVTTHKWNGSNPANQTDPSNFASTYSAEIYMQFARRT